MAVRVGINGFGRIGRVGVCSIASTFFDARFALPLSVNSNLVL